MRDSLQELVQEFYGLLVAYDEVVCLLEHKSGDYHKSTDNDFLIKADLHGTILSHARVRYETIVTKLRQSWPKKCRNAMHH